MNAIDDAAERANELLRAYILRQYHEEYPDGDGHLASCEEVSVLSLDAYNGSYGCDTGCEYLRLEAVIGCPHEDPVEYEYGKFGDLACLIEDLESEA